ncbi:Kinase superfamily protein isoform 1 [Hibiscus syriacus]|uniref:Kinase superfamily protein isoform 1 n=1 Tax=Hibiscus syriacus TaxID=106335 RepID=A0A6A2ZUH4_HIBSY|nr:Kinase superfamily protein isoform 1 [Hibiscus syriacus]
MPTPVIVARQCLAPEAATALDEAVAVARRRGHAQTTSLHAVSTLLIIRSSSALRDASLELCISVSLDRVPSGQHSNDPPVSNSLLAAIKRSQANQRRQPPENFHVFRDISHRNNSSISSVKVELQHLILSILDDPVISRVFREAGFRSSEIKLAIIRPLPNLLRYSRPRGPPVFLCNLENPDPGHRGFNFPFPGFTSYTEEGTGKRIGEVLARRRNPLLVGVYAYDALANFIKKKKDGLNIICIENYIAKCINEGLKKAELESKFEEMGRVVVREMERSGVVVNYGALEIFVNGKNKEDNDDEEEEGGVGYLVEHLTSLMESFVPFGGLFPTQTESKGSLTGSYEFMSPCFRLCSKKCEQEEIGISKGGGFDVSVADQFRSTLPSWLQMAEAKDAGQLLNTKIAGVQKKWDDICRRVRHIHQVPESNTYQPKPLKRRFRIGLQSVSSSNKLMKPTSQNRATLARDFSGCLPANIDVINGSVSSHQAQSSSSSSPNFGGPLDPRDFKKLFAAVTKRVGWQDEAANLICQTVANGGARKGKCHGASRSGDIWLNFSGPDRCGKKKIAIALAVVIYGDRENFIDIDLSSEDGVRHSDLRFRGKTLVDYVAKELSRKPLAVVFLENVDKADIHVLSSLSQAIQTGKFPDSHGREVSTNNAIFVTTSTSISENQVIYSKTQTSKYSEDNILRARGWPLQILIKHDNNTISHDSRPESISMQGSLNKRKLIGSNETTEQHEIMEMVKRANRTSCPNLDLNVPAEETDDGTIENDSVGENPTPWLQHFFEQPVENVIFKQYDFDALAQKVSDDISKSFRESIGSECSLEIDPKVMEQLLAASYLSDNMVVTDWIAKVLSKGFVEVKKCNLNTRSIVKLVPDLYTLPSKKLVGITLPGIITVNLG